MIINVKKEIKAIDTWRTNGLLIADCAKLGYLRKDKLTLDPTYGLGIFWSVWRPNGLIAHDIDPTKSPIGYGVDATQLPYSNKRFYQVVLDPPYKLNGTPTKHIDDRYGVADKSSWQDRMILISKMLAEAARVLGDGYLLFKCQDQVVSGKKRWQTIEFANQAASLGLGLVDRFDRIGYRPQPSGRRQITTRGNASTLLIFKRGWNNSYK